jgi:ribosome-binding factor A
MKDKYVTMRGIIHELAARFVQQEANTDPLITVTNIDLSPDWRRATIMFTTIPNGREADALVFLKRSASDMRHFFKKHGRFKTIPHLDFMVDAGERHRQDMDELVRDIAEGKR